MKGKLCCWGGPQDWWWDRGAWASSRYFDSACETTATI